MKHIFRHLSSRQLLLACSVFIVCLALVSSIVYAAISGFNQKVSLSDSAQMTNNIVVEESVITPSPEADDVQDLAKEQNETAVVNAEKEIVDVATTTTNQQRVVENTETKNSETPTTTTSVETKKVDVVLSAQKTETAEVPPVVEPETYRASITVRGAGGGSTYQFDVDVGSTVEQAMRIATASGFSYKTKQFGGLGTYVTTINGQVEDAKNNMRWIFSVNNKKATAGISTVKLKKGDTIQWSYEKSF